jgi:hypothetical protein
MFARSSSPTHVLVLWPLVALALIVRLTAGGLASPEQLSDHALQDLSRLSILCDDSGDRDDPQHHSTPPQDDSFLLAEAFDVFILSVALCFFIKLTAICLRRPWILAPIRGTPTPKRTSLCPQGPPA